MFQRGNIGYYSNINVSNSGMWQSISLIKYGMDNLAEHSLTKLMVSCDLQRLMVTNQVAFEQWDLHLTYEFEHVINRPPGTCFQIGNLTCHHFYQTFWRSDLILGMFYHDILCTQKFQMLIMLLFENIWISS